MSRSFSNDRFDDDFSDSSSCVPLDQVTMPVKLRLKLLARDRAQIEQMRLSYELGCPMVRVVLKRRHGGGFDIEDGRHRVLAATLAGLSCINALIVD